MLKKYASALILCLSLATSAAFAGKTLEKFKGNHAGTFAFNAPGTFFSYSGSGPGTAVAKIKSKGTQASITINASDSTMPGVTYSTTLNFKAHGKCTVLSVVPGVSDAKGSGTWKYKGGKITYTISGSDASGSYTVNGTITAHGKKISVLGNFTASTTIPGAPSSGYYSFN